MGNSTSLERHFEFVGLKGEFDPSDRLSMESWFTLAHAVEYSPAGSALELQGHQSPSEYVYFLTEGLAREFSIKPDGQEINLAFHRPMAVIGSFESFKKQTNNEYAIQMVNNGGVYKLSCDRLAECLQQYPDIETWYRLVMCRMGAQLQERLTRILAKNQNQRLAEFVDESPDLVRDVPTQYLSSYLDIPSVVVNIVKKHVNSDDFIPAQKYSY